MTYHSSNVWDLRSAVDSLMAAESGTVGARRRGRPPKISQREIVEAALDLAREEGLDAVTTRRLAARMNVTPMTLYTYAATKDELLDLMTSAAFEAFDFEPDTSQPWPDQLYAGFLGLYQVMRANPVGIELVTAPRAMTGREVDRVREKLLTILESASLSRQDAVDVFTTVGSYVVGIVSIEVARDRRADELRQHLAGLPSAEFPVATKSAVAWTRPIPQRIIERGLRHLIDGLCADLES
jgi:AcrR family transcriptional regulator